MSGKLSKTIKKLKKSSVYKDAEQFDYAKNNDIIISIGLKDIEDFFNPYSYKDYELVNKDVLSFIHENEKLIPISENVDIDIYTEKEIKENDEQRIKMTLKRQHAEEVVRLNHSLKQNIILTIVNFFVGVLILTGSLLLEKSKFFMSNVVINTLSIIAWVFIWHSIEMLFIKRPVLKTELIKDFRLMNAKVHIKKYKDKTKEEGKNGKSRKQT